MAKEKLKPRQLEEPILPAAIALVAVGILGLIFFNINPSPTGAATELNNDDVFCVRKGTDNSNVAVTTLQSCCFMIENTDRCRPAPDESAYYRGRTGEFIDKYEYDFACFGGSTERVFFTEEVRFSCGLDI